MKKIFLLVFTVCSILSCSKEEKFEIDNFPQNWILVKMTGQIRNSETVGEKMAWQEYYLLKSDGTFIKYRERDGINFSASGNFSFVERADGKYLELSYNEDSQIVGSCYNNQTESLWLESNNILTSTWFACDGPGLVYKRKE
jgi:hypothetical protein